MKHVEVKVNYKSNYRQKYTKAVMKAVRRHETDKDNSDSYPDTRTVRHIDTLGSGDSTIHDGNSN